MTWNLKQAGIPPSSAILYDSPFSASSSKYAIGASKINHGVAQYLYPAENTRRSLNMQSAPMPVKVQSLRYNLDANGVTNFAPGAVLTTGDIYEENLKSIHESFTAEHYTMNTVIGSSHDFRDMMQRKMKLVESILIKMKTNQSSIIKHKVYSTPLPAWYITKITFLILLEQEMANEYGGDSVKHNAIKKPEDALDIIYDAYMKTSTVEHASIFGIKTKDSLANIEPHTYDLPSQYSAPEVPKEFQHTLHVEYLVSRNLNSEERQIARDAITNLANTACPFPDGRYLTIDDILKGFDKYADAYLKFMKDTTAQNKESVSSEVGKLIAIVTPSITADVHEESVVVVPDETPNSVIVDIQATTSEEKTPEAVATTPVIRESVFMKIADTDEAVVEAVTKLIYKDQPALVMDVPVQTDASRELAIIDDEIGKLENEIANLKKSDKKEDAERRKVYEARLNELQAKRPAVNKQASTNSEKYSISNTSKRLPWPQRLGIRSVRKEKFSLDEAFEILIYCVIIVLVCIGIRKLFMETNKTSGGSIYSSMRRYIL